MKSHLTRSWERTLGRFALFVACLGACLLPGAAADASWEAGIKVGYFEPVDSFFEALYKKGIFYGFSGGWIHPKGMGLLIGVDLYLRDIQYNGRSHSVSLIPVTASFVYLPFPDQRITPILGFGWGWYRLSDSSLFSKSTNTWDALGYHGLGGVRVVVYRALFADVQVKYSYAKAEGLDNSNIGGWSSSFGFGYRF